MAPEAEGAYYMHFAPCSALSMTARQTPILTHLSDEEMQAQRDQIAGLEVDQLSGGKLDLSHSVCTVSPDGDQIDVKHQ